jgi:hypothetical protein
LLPSLLPNTAGLLMRRALKICGAVLGTDMGDAVAAVASAVGQRAWKPLCGKGSEARPGLRIPCGAAGTAAR